MEFKLRFNVAKQDHTEGLKFSLFKHPVGLALARALSKYGEYLVRVERQKAMVYKAVPDQQPKLMGEVEYSPDLRRYVIFTDTGKLPDTKGKKFRVIITTKDEEFRKELEGLYAVSVSK
ncbi:MAG: hypothetical protein KDH96_01970 [Candidatus Riesia sp.]|nr:hypothetical protein [Candidatus Riesia sp.]